MHVRVLELFFSGTQPSNDSFNMFGRRYKKWAYLHWTLNANTTAADWAVVGLQVVILS